MRNGSLIQQTAARSGSTALSGLATGEGRIGGTDVVGSGSPDLTAGPGGVNVVDGYGRVLHNRWNRDLPPVATVRPGEVVQLLCRDALDIGEAARTMTPDGTLTIDLGLVHPLTGPVEIQGAEPGDILEVEILDVGPLVDFGYVVISPVLGLFGSLRPELLAPLAPWSEASQLSDPTPGPAAGAIPEDQPYNSGAPFLQTFRFERGQSSGFAAFTGVDTGREARIPIAPFMGILGVAPLRKGMYRTFSPDVSGGMGGNTDIRQLVKGSRVQLPVYVPGAMFSAGDGHMAQGDGEVTGTAVETLMAVTLRFGLVKNTVIASPRAVVPAADPTQLAMPAEMLNQGYYQTVGTGPDLMDNAKTAVREMIDWLVSDQRLSLHEAYTLCSVAGDLKINETVDLPRWLVSMTLPRGIFG
ncbi:acetamidase/formamidase family protein (plasmid) [Streptomyces sp. NBC_01340]|uniref:acetamidase/formamidase family protein n=1 Tax=unclassified Streptomyces TaxID=2593676 RepID=UPI00225253F7|nr:MULTISPECIES: acetamidase/formamidase family protein [unclassified Streptomyces]MCX4462322.1 acetamidase/formamidase family protein [Streptomyces sp. NBC_01719]MCX4500760.1 acetamidase/formamidase family protein [Streptomyces sp. NBC_01728]MCX4598718.1 acetamidase/formamidase family protein [Streptomyces sp. NBC_01549]WSI35968.1 acetamidase/formamidase family protein [Streptomyces sp. NBC_01340]WSI43844.1 acetamidase/formamidase family protein [Streptomyces sp. NBC_01340]